MQIKLVSGVSDFRIYYGIIISGEDINPLICDIAQIVDIPTAGPFVGLLEERLEGRRRSFHAGTGCPEIRANIPQQTVGGRALYTIIRYSGNYADAVDNRRPGDPELQR